MPDKWEYPWFAAWDLGFHCVALAHLDPAFAKYQLTLLCREWFQHPNGALPAYEWDFGDVNPPVQAWAALEVFAIDGAKDLDFLGRIFDKLLVNFTWWVNLRGRVGLEPVRGRLPRARQHRPARPLPPPGRRDAPAVRRHRLDGVLRHLDGHHRRDPAGVWPTAGARSRRQVPRALRRHPGGHGRPRRVGRGGRPLLRQARHPRRDRRADQGALDGRASSRCSPPPRSASTCSSRPRRSGSGSPSCSTTRGRSASWPSATQFDDDGRRMLLGVVGIDHLKRLFDRAVRRARVPLAVRPARHLRRATASTRTSSRSRASRPRSTTSRPSRPRRCSAATRTGGGPSGSPSTTSSWTPSTVTTGSSATP